MIDNIFLVLLLIIALIMVYYNRDKVKHYYYKMSNTSEYEVVDAGSVSETTYKLINNKPVVNIIRNNNELVTGDNTVYFEPNYILKDNLSANDIDSTEFSYAQLPDDIPDKAWTDYRISQYPSYYSNNINDEKTNLKLFFDKQNKYHDTINENYYYNNLKRMPIPACYIGKNINNVCDFNNRLERIPLNLSNVREKEIYNKQTQKEIMKNNKFMNGSLYKGRVMGY